ncbi:hypothetical protein CHCC20348_3978 [Bacillus paralicheniformis]|nr:hypothetical protein CHCC20348_3978 [Bacillus paralicheniformis]
MISSASSLPSVMISMAPSSRIGARRSISLPFNFPAIDFFFKPGLIDAAISSVVVVFANSLTAPSGNLIFTISDILVTPFFLQNKKSPSPYERDED